MKRLLTLLCALLLLLSGCSAKSSPSIRPADLTENEQALLRMFGQSYPSQVFDFTAPEGSVGLIIRRQQLVEGEWVSTSHYLQVAGQAGRVAISFDDLADGLRCAILQDGNVDATSVTRDSGLDLTGMFTATETLRTSIPAALHTEIPLLMHLREAGTEMPFPGAGMADYPDAAPFADYDAVYVVTATFTDKPLE